MGSQKKEKRKKKSFKNKRKFCSVFIFVETTLKNRGTASVDWHKDWLKHKNECDVPRVELLFPVLSECRLFQNTRAPLREENLRTSFQSLCIYMCDKNWRLENRGTISVGIDFGGGLQILLPFNSKQFFCWYKSLQKCCTLGWGKGLLNFLSPPFIIPVRIV